jgi:hypothetical protein
MIPQHFLAESIRVRALHGHGPNVFDPLAKLAHRLRVLAFSNLDKRCARTLPLLFPVRSALLKKP